MRFGSLALACFVSLAASVRADVRVVAPSGAPFTSIQAAVNAASDGDVILVRPGAYDGFTIDDKELDVVGDVNGQVSCVTRVTIRNLAATRHASITSFIVSAPTSSAIVLEMNQGSVRLEDVQSVGGFATGSCTNQTAGGAGLEASMCADVSVVRGTLRGGDVGGGDNCFGSTGGAGLEARQSRVAIYGSVLRGAHGGGACWQGCNACGYQGYSGLGGIGGAGCFMESGVTVFASASSFTGGQAGGNCHATDDGGWGGSGIWSFSTSTARAVSCSFQGGPPPSSGFAFQPSVPIEGPGVVTSTLLPRFLRATIPVRENQASTLTFTGSPGDTVTLIVGTQPRWEDQRGFTGIRLVRREHPELVQQIGTIPASGVLTTTWTVPDLGPGVQSVTTFLQAIYTTPSGDRFLSPPATQVLLDAAF